MKSWSLGNPPRAVRTAKLDNLLLVPASALSQKDRYQKLANSLSRGRVLIVTSSTDDRKSEILRKVARHRKSKGQQVTTYLPTA